MELHGREVADEFCLKNARLPLNLEGSFTCRKSTIWDRRLYFPSEGRRAEDFFAFKNRKTSVGFESANLGTKGQHATSRPPMFVALHFHIWPQTRTAPCANICVRQRVQECWGWQVLNIIIGQWKAPQSSNLIGCPCVGLNNARQGKSVKWH